MQYYLVLGLFLRSIKMQINEVQAIQVAESQAANLHQLS